MEEKLKTSNRITYFITSLLFSITMFYSCTNKYCNDLSAAIDNIYNAESNENIIDLKAVYKFEWDVLYIFKEYESPESISKIIGFECQCAQVPDNEEMYLFIKDGVIIRKYIGVCNGYSLISSNQIGYDGVQKIDANTAKFKVVKGDILYSLTPLEK